MERERQTDREGELHWRETDREIEREGDRERESYIGERHTDTERERQVERETDRERETERGRATLERDRQREGELHWRETDRHRERETERESYIGERGRATLERERDRERETERERETDRERERELQWRERAQSRAACGPYLTQLTVVGLLIGHAWLRVHGFIQLLQQLYRHLLLRQRALTHVPARTHTTNIKHCRPHFEGGFFSLLSTAHLVGHSVKYCTSGRYNTLLPSFIHT